MTGVREEMPMLPRHRVGGDFMLEKAGVYRMGVEGGCKAPAVVDERPGKLEAVVVTVSGVLLLLLDTGVRSGIAASKT